MIRLKTKNPVFSGERAGIRFRNGEATASELSGRQRQVLTRFGIQIIEPEAGGSPNALSDLTIPQLREKAELEGVDLTGRTRKDDILEAFRAS